MQNLIIVDNPVDWPLEIPDVQVISGKQYLASDDLKKSRNVRVFNVCQSYKYQTVGYYVSLLAAARGHKPVPSVATIQDMKTQAIVKLAGDELEELIQKSLHDLHSDQFTLSIYFGKNLAKKYDRISANLYSLFHAPFVRADFAREDRRWKLKKVGPVAFKEIPKNHHEDVVNFAREYFSGKRAPRAGKKADVRFSMAILYNDKEELAPSDPKAIQKFIKAAEKLHMEVEVITKDDYSRLAEFDALFIRETTAVNHYTFRFAQRAAAEGLVVMDDPDSILKCTNKVYLNELLERNNIPAPKTLIIHKENAEIIEREIGYPCVLKSPDSSFSQGVIKVSNPVELKAALAELFEGSELLIAQEFLPTDFDWRVGVIDGKPFYLCKYFMAKKDWKILTKDAAGNFHDGKSETMPVELGPKKLIALATKAADLIGKGFYGLDIKQQGNNFFVIEINDNPSIDSGVEDQILKDDLYARVMEVFLKRIIETKEGKKQT